MADEKCPLCDLNLKELGERPDGHDFNYYECLNCGKYKVTHTALPRVKTLEDWEKATLGHQAWRNRNNPELFTVNSENVRKIYSENIPDPEEQLENLITYWAQTQDKNIGGRLNKDPNHLRAKIGALNAEAVNFVATEAVGRGLLDGGPEGGTIKGKLTFRGWQLYRELGRGKTRSLHAFMAMPFGNEIITGIVNEVFRPAVEETGFVLKRLDDALHSGLIDDQLRVEIRQCKFLIAELTDMNRGAYWEAGFAEGLGKRVIYTCEKSFFDNKDKELGKGTHFDTNHHMTILWNADKPDEAARQIKAAIRNTFPFEAKMPPEPG